MSRRPATPPYGLLAELTHACPLRCVYCSNPLALVAREEELATHEWVRVVEEAASIGVVQSHLSGGEPLERPDLEEIVRAARGCGLYTQLVTSGLGLAAARLSALARSGLESVQLSVQGATPGSSDPVAGRRSFLEKQAVARLVVAEGLVLTLNVVLHRHNLDDLDAIVDLALDWGADRLELANVQLYGWALANRAHLLPAAEQLSRASERFHRRRAELGDRLAMVWVRQDYLDGRPKPCMNGWGTTSMTVAPDGRVLPCPAATGIAGLRYDSVREHGLAWIWAESEAFNAFRGEDWMREPCRSCAFRHDDHGGCRCQTFALTGDATRTDPACRWSPDHHVVEEAVALAGSAPAGRRGWDGIRYRARADDRRRAGPSNGHGTDKGDRG